MPDDTRKILVLVEGEKNDAALMRHLFIVYELDIRYEIVPYRTNIYTLYQEMFSDGHPEEYDLLQILKMREWDETRKHIFDERYSDILLIFDFDPQAPDFEPEKILRMAECFVESSDMGKLYINYPMVEAFYHMASIPDAQFNTYTVTQQELMAAHQYKKRVNRMNRDNHIRRFALSKSEYNCIIQQHIGKAFYLTGSRQQDKSLPDLQAVLTAELALLSAEGLISVLSTCCFFIPEYSPELIQ